MFFLELISDLVGFAKENKKLIILPIVLFLLALSALLFLTQGSVIAPFIYTLF